MTNLELTLIPCSMAEAEDFIVELTRLVNQGNGVVPSRCQSKITELVSTAAMTKQSVKKGKSKVADSIRTSGSSKKAPKTKLLDKGQVNPEVVNSETVDEFNAIAVHLDSLSTGLTARYIEVRVIM